MRRISWISITAITLIFLTSSVFAPLEDFTPSTSGFDPSLSAQTGFDPVCSQNAARISRVESKLDNVQTSADACFKEADIERLQKEINENIAHENNIFLGRMLALLIVFTVFFFTCVFLSKAKGYL